MPHAIHTASAGKKYIPFIAITLIVYTGLLWYSKQLLFFDEDVFVTNLQSPFMQQAWQRSFLVKQFFKAQHFLFGKNPAGYHIISLLLHLLCTIIATMLFRKILGDCVRHFNDLQVYWASFIFYSFFLITPVHSEPLCYILAQGVLVFSFFALFAILFFVKGITESSWWMVPALISFAASLLCYEISWMLPLMLAAIFFIYRKAGRVIEVSRSRLMVTAFFVLLAVWFCLKQVFISKSLVADYDGITAANIDLVAAARNGLILFVRNFIPPVNNTLYFIVAAGGAFVIFITFVVWVFKKYREFFALILLLLLLLVLSFAPASPFGIDSHDSESERYVYFSSVFAAMLVALIVITAAGSRFLRLTAGVMGVGYLVILFVTVDRYKRAGVFSQQYLSVLNQYTKNVKTVFTVNQPSQFGGALMIRALTRLPEIQKNNGQYTVLSEYMQYMHSNNSSDYITFSAAPLTRVPAKIAAVQLPLSAALLYFPETGRLFSEQQLTDGKSAVAALRNDSLYVFK